jgi:FkbM family methyltransferase
MKLNGIQKIQTAYSAVKYRSEIKQFLIRRYWRSKKQMKVQAGGITAFIDTTDFLSNVLLWCTEYVEGYEPALCELLAKLIKDSKVYADIGGNIGIFSILPAIINPNCKIFYFEMDKTIRPLLIKNMRLNNVEEARITIVNAAVGEHIGDLEYVPHPYSFLANLNNESINDYELKLSAPVIRLDDYFDQHGEYPDLLKIDIDGAEMVALRGMTRILSETKPDLLLEVHPVHLRQVGSSASQVCDFLREFSYQFFSIPEFRYTKSRRLKKMDDFNSLNSETGDMIFVTSARRRSLGALID